MMGAPQAIIALVGVLRLMELLLAKSNARALLAEGGIEHGARHYPLFMLLHGAWLVSMAVTVAPEKAPDATLFAVFLGLQLLRLWTIGSLGRFWTTRVIVLPDRLLVTRGPYRWLRHPNYAIVAAEIAVLPLVFGAWPVAVAFSLLNAALLRHRIGIEEAALGR